MSWGWSPLHQKNPWILTLQTFSALSCTSLYSAEIRSLVVSRVQQQNRIWCRSTFRGRRWKPDGPWVAWKKIASIHWEDSHGMPFVIFCACGSVWLGMVWVIGLPYRKKRLRREGQSGVALIEKTPRKPNDQSIWDKYVRSELVIRERERETERDRENSS